MIVFDIEADNLLREATKIHCIVIYDSTLPGNFLYAYDGPEFAGYERHGGINSGVEYIRQAIAKGEVVVGHNICGYDLNLLLRLFGGAFAKGILHPYHFFSQDRLIPQLSLSRAESTIFDTFICSCLLYPQRHEHGLESWGTELGIEKPVQEQWHTLDEGMLNRCTQDVMINKKLWYEKIFPKLEEHYNKGIRWDRAIALEQVIQQIHAQQEIDGVRYDILKAINLWHQLDEEAGRLRQQILSETPKRVKAAYGTTAVAKPYTKTGAYSAMTIRHWAGREHELPKLNIRGPFSRIEYEELNLDSDDQVKQYLLSLGWKPTEWNMNKKTRERTSPKLTEDSYASLPDGVGRTIADYNIVTHRQGMIANRKGKQTGGLWKVREDGRIPAKAFTCGTPTSRYRHQEVICNIPRPSTPYGGEIRELFCVADDDYTWMLGLDLKGIEIRMAAHFAFRYPGGPELAAEILAGDFHTKNAEIWGVDRNHAKTGLYALNHLAHVKLIELRGSLTAAQQ